MAAAAPAASGKPAEAVAQQPSEIVPPTSEMLAKEANIEIKPDAAPNMAPAPETQTPAPPAPAAQEKPAAAPAMPEMQMAAAPPAKETTKEATKETQMAPPPVQETPAPAAPPKKMAMAAPEPLPPPETRAGDSDASVDARRDSDGLRLTFSFASATPAALFRRADTVWVVFDSTKPIDVAPIRNKGGALIAEATRVPLEHGQAIRIRLNRPQMPSLVGDDQPDRARWTVTFADTMQTPTQPLVTERNVADPSHANVTVALAKPAGSRLHQAAGFCRIVAAGIGSRRRHSSELRRHHRPDHARHDHPQPAGRPDAVIGHRRIGSSRGHRGAADFRRR
jgi:cell division septation protein DedD